MWRLRYADSSCIPWMIVDRGGDATVILDELVHSKALFTVRSSWNRRVTGGNKQAYC